MKDKLEMFIFFLIKKLVLILPMKTRYFVAEMFGMLFYWVVKNRRLLTFKNIKMAFPEYDDNSVKKTVIASYKNIAKTFFETLWTEDLFRKSLVRTQGIEKLEKALEKGKGIVMLSLHLDNWEIGGAAVADKNISIYAVAKEQRNKKFNEELNKTRIKTGVKVIQAGNKSPKDLIRALKENAVLALISDQFVEDVEVTFFGRKTFAPAGAATLAMKFNSPVILTYPIRDKDNGHTLIVDKEIEIVNTGDKEKDLKENTQIFMNEIENVIRKYPEQWFWQHRRWRDL